MSRLRLEIFRALLDTKQNEPLQLTPEEEADLIGADADIARGELATDEDVRAMWARHGL